MSGTSTHDSKRGEDVRARLNVLSEIPERWEQAARRWAQMNEPHRPRVNGMPAPLPNDEYLLYQTLVGALPFDAKEYETFPQRIKDYLTKAIREAKTVTNWIEPNEPYENACNEFVDRILDRKPGNRFWTDFTAFQSEIAAYGVYNSLSQTTLKLACPGLPDFYQGAELWDLNLVDPDNRRPVDFQTRARLLRELRESQAGDRTVLLPELLHSRQDARIKLLLILEGLRARRENRKLFETGGYLPASVLGNRAEHVVAFFRSQRAARGDKQATRYALAVVPRFLTSLVRPDELPLGERVWNDTRIQLPDGAPPIWHNVVAEATLHAECELALKDIFAEFPTAILLAHSA